MGLEAQTLSRLASSKKALVPRKPEGFERRGAQTPTAVHEALDDRPLARQALGRTGRNPK